MKFSKPAKNAFYTGLKTEIDAYFHEKGIHQYANREFFIKAFLLVGIYVGAYLSLFFIEADFAWALIPWILMGISGVMMFFNVIHDASHYAIFKQKRPNEYLTYLGEMIGINTYIWHIRHNVQHHTFTNVLGGDLIVDAAPLLRLSHHQPYLWIHRFQAFYAPIFYMFYSIFWIVFIDFRLFSLKNICNLKNIEHPTREWVKLIGFKIFYFSYNLLLPWLFTDFAFLEVLALFMIMQVCGGTLLSFIVILSHFVEDATFPHPEGDVIDNSWSEHNLETTCDFSPQSYPFGWVTGGLNTHVAHHLFPHICHVHYHHITPIIEEYCVRHGYPYVKESLGEAMLSHFRHLKKLSKPDLPMEIG